MADRGFAEEGRGQTMASAWSTSLNEGLGAEPTAGSRGSAPWWEPLVRGQSFLYIFIQKVAKC